MLHYDPDHPRRSWASGTKFSTDPDAKPQKRPPPEPVRVEVVPGYEGVYLEFWDNPVPLMTKRLYAALQDAGVTNIDAYRAEIADTTSKTLNMDYVAFNIIGKVSAADLKASRTARGSTNRMISADFDAVTIKGEAARGALLFRLAESVGAIVVHEKVRDHLEDNGIDTLTFIEPENWAG
jgi:hypothetical protein